MRPELILYNANIITIDDTQPRAQAVAIANGRFLAVGSDDDVQNLTAAGVPSIDLGGKTVVPGFIDAHAHPDNAGRKHLREVDCDLRSIEDIMEAVRARAEVTPPGAWVLGFKYDDMKTSEARPLSRADLDLAAPAHPVD